MTLVSKNVYIDKLNDIVKKYNSTYHSTIKMKSFDMKSNRFIVKKLIIKILNLKLVIFLEYQNIKIFLLKVALQINLKKFLLLKRLKMLCCGHMSLMILTGKNLLEPFTKNNFKKLTKNSLGLKR